MSPQKTVMASLCTCTLLACSPLPQLGSASPSAATAPSAPSDAEGLFVLARAADGAGQWDAAELHYARLLSLQPTHLRALNAMAVIHAQTGRSAQAFALFKRALDVDPQAPYVHNNYGYALLREGQLDQARLELQTALDLNPASSQARKNLELLAQASALQSPSAEPATHAHEAQQELVVVAQSVYALRSWPVAPAQQLPAQAADGREDAPCPACRLPTSLHGVKIEVANGVGLRHLARSTAAQLAPWGVVTVRLTNAQNYRQATTEIQFASGQQGAADALSARLPAGVKALASTRLAPSVQLRLVLGRDLVGQSLAASRESRPGPITAQSPHDGWSWG